MKKIYILLALAMAFAVMPGSAKAATIESPWYTSRQNVDSNLTLVATYKGSPTRAFSLFAYDQNHQVIDGHKFGIPFLKGQGIQLDINSFPNQNNHLYAFNTYTHDANGRSVTDLYNLNLIRNFDTAYITLQGKPTDVAEVLFLILEIHNANGSVALQRFGTYFDTTQTGFAQMVIKARNLAAGQTLNVYPVFKGVTIPQERTLDGVTIQVDLYSSN